MRWRKMNSRRPRLPRPISVRKSFLRRAGRRSSLLSTFVRRVGRASFPELFRGHFTHPSEAVTRHPLLARLRISLTSASSATDPSRAPPCSRAKRSGGSPAGDPLQRPRDRSARSPSHATWPRRDSRRELHCHSSRVAASVLSTGTGAPAAGVARPARRAIHPPARVPCPAGSLPPFEMLRLLGIKNQCSLPASGRGNDGKTPASSRQEFRASGPPFEIHHAACTSFNTEQLAQRIASDLPSGSDASPPRLMMKHGFLQPARHQFFGHLLARLHESVSLCVTLYSAFGPRPKSALLPPDCAFGERRRS